MGSPGEYALADQFVRHGLYGSAGREVGTFAIYLLGSLSQPASSLVHLDDAVGWEVKDHTAFGYLRDLESGIPFIETAPDVENSDVPGVDGSDLAELHRAFGRFNGALPFSSGEQQWLMDPTSYTPLRGQSEAEALIGLEAEVLSGGVRQIVRGRDIVRRWWAWRREVDEFAGQGSLEAARQELGTIATQLVIPSQWPRGYEHIATRLGVEPRPAA